MFAGSTSVHLAVSLVRGNAKNSPLVKEVRIPKLSWLRVADLRCWRIALGLVQRLAPGAGGFEHG